MRRCFSRDGVLTLLIILVRSRLSRDGVLTLLLILVRSRLSRDGVLTLLLLACRFLRFLRKRGKRGGRLEVLRAIERVRKHKFIKFFLEELRHLLGTLRSGMSSQEAAGHGLCMIFMTPAMSLRQRRVARHHEPSLRIAVNLQFLLRWN